MSKRERVRFRERERERGSDRDNVGTEKRRHRITDALSILEYEGEC